MHDFWQDGEPSQDAVDSDLDSMRLYAAKIDEYLEAKAAKPGGAHFFMFAALQSMLIPIPEVEAQHADQHRPGVRGRLGPGLQLRLAERDELRRHVERHDGAVERPPRRFPVPDLLW